MSKEVKQVVSFRIDPKLKAQAESYATAHDMKVSEVYNLAVKRLVREGAAPVTRNDLNVFYSKLVSEISTVNVQDVPRLESPKRSLTWRERITGRLVE